MTPLFGFLIGFLIIGSRIPQMGGCPSQSAQEQMSVPHDQSKLANSHLVLPRSAIKWWFHEFRLTTVTHSSSHDAIVSWKSILKLWTFLLLWPLVSKNHQPQVVVCTRSSSGIGGKQSLQDWRCGILRPMEKDPIRIYDSLWIIEYPS